LEARKSILEAQKSILEARRFILEATKCIWKPASPYSKQGCADVGFECTFVTVDINSPDFQKCTVHHKKWLQMLHFRGLKNFSYLNVKI
jgi:hypothetical protein